MKTSKEILVEVREILKTDWKVREGKDVPDPEAVSLGNDAVRIDATVLYADLTDSTGLVEKFKDWFAAEVYKSYLVAVCHVMRNNDGRITAFDGDRVMAVFLGDNKSAAAAKAALQVNYIVKEVNAAIKGQYANSAYELTQTIGIDTSKIFVAKTGIRNYNDLVWVGRAANYAAKLCGVASADGRVVIAEAVFDALADSSKYGGNPRRLMWEKSLWPERRAIVYKSNWYWEF